MKTLRALGEFGLIEKLRRKLPCAPPLVCGIGDDAAVLKPSKENQLLTTDLLVEGVDFSFRSATPKEAGRKALAVNLSDIAAMGGEPQTALISLVLPQNAKLRAVDEFFGGIAALAKKFGVSIAGGDLSKGPCWMISVSILGRMNSVKPVLRSGAKAGDLIAVSGTLGGSILGKHLHFDPRVREGQFLARSGANAMIDVSDGLLQDLRHILFRSKTAADLYLEQVPVSEAAFKLAKGNVKQALAHALTDGEDFELLFTVSKNAWASLGKQWSKHFKTRLTVLGEISRGRPQLRLWFAGLDVSGQFHSKGYDHFK